MNKKELAEVIREWLHSPPEKRRLLEAAIEQQYQEAKESLWEGSKEDTLAAWLADCIRTSADESGFPSELINSVAEYLEGKEAERSSPETSSLDLPVAAYRPLEEEAPGAVVPGEDEIRRSVRNILAKIDSIK